MSTVLLLVSAMLLMAVIAAALTGVRVRVEQTGSMAPVLHRGDLVLVRSTPVQQVRAGDVIGVRGPSGKVILHRVEHLASDGVAVRVHTRGDANPTGEDWTIPQQADVALMVGSVPAVGSIVNAGRGPIVAGVVLLAGLLLAGFALRSVWSKS